MRASAAAIIELARDPRYVGGTVGVLAVLHTWTQQLNLHPHVSLPWSAAADLRGRQHLAPGAPKLPGAHQGSRKLVRGKLRAMLRCSVLISLSLTRRGASVGSPPRHRLGQR